MSRQIRQTPKRDMEIEMPGCDLRLKLNPKALSWDLFLFEDITPKKVAELIQHLITLDATDIKAPINLMICSGGGYCDAGFALIDVMLSLRHPVRTIVLGEACSMGALIFLAGTPGYRLMSKRSLVMFHPISTSISDYGPYIHDRVSSMDNTDVYSKQLIKERTHLPKDLIEKASNGELWLTPGQAVQYKVADGIITDANMPVLTKQVQRKKQK